VDELSDMDREAYLKFFQVHKEILISDIGYSRRTLNRWHLGRVKPSDEEMQMIMDVLQEILA
jgi:hypothetical protein